MIDLKAAFGKRYKIFHNPSWDAEKAEVRKEARDSGYEAWYYELRGPNVTIYPFTHRLVAAHWWSGRHQKALKQACEGARVLDTEIIYNIPFSAVQGVLDRVQIYRRRVLSDSEKARLRDMCVKYHFRAR